MTTVEELRTGFASPPREAAPMMRWWWFGPSVERAELDRELTAMARAGFGGVEVAYVYPLAPATTTFLSDEFLADLAYAAGRAGELGLRFDLTLGSGWSFGGPHITSDLAAKRLRWDPREIGGEALEVPVTSPWPGDELVAAYLGTDQLSIVDGVIRVPAGAGPRSVLLAWAQLTGQNVKRAAFGAEGPVLDHYNPAATAAHLAAVGDRLLDAVPAAGLGSVFCDSLEVYGSDWTPGLPVEFEKRRGYPLLPVLHRLVTDGPDAARVRADYHHTLAELYEENFVAACRAWAAGRGVKFRIQSYGTPPATVSSFRHADLFEGEGWGWREITQTRWASSAAHLYGRMVASSEIWTWVHAPSFRATPLDLKGEAHDHLLNGINQFAGHGWPYSPVGAPGLGWFFYAAGALDDRNPWWPVMPELNAYLTRLCWLLRQGEPVADVAVYLPGDELYAAMGAATGGSLDLWREAVRLIPAAVPATIRDAGLDYDLIDDDALTVTPPGRYGVVVVPDGVTPAGGWFDRVAAAGGTVVTPGGLAAALPVPDLAIPPDVGVVHRRLPSADIYFVANTGATRREFAVDAEEWDPHTGSPRPVTHVVLHPLQATVLVVTSPAPAAAASLPVETWRALDGDWQVAFADEPSRPVRLPHVWEDERNYSGAATYTTSFDLDGTRVVLDLGDSRPADDDPAGLSGRSYHAPVRGPVGEIAEVRLNGVDCGTAWAPPYRLDLTEAARPGRNELEITVRNTAANALAADKHIGRLAADSAARYGLRFAMQDLDRALATVRSGLLSVPRISTSA